MINITPYKEIKGGKESIYDHVRAENTVPGRVLLYLQNGMPHAMSPGTYSHPFKEGKKLAGPYLYTDGDYIWDRDTREYVEKYGLILSEEFIKHVMSPRGREYLKNRLRERISAHV